MAQRGKNQTEAALFAGMLFILFAVAVMGLEHQSGRRDNIFDYVKTASLDYQVWKNGYIVQYSDSGYMAYEVEPVGYLLDGFIVEQDFDVTEEMLRYNDLAVGIQVATYGRKNDVNLYVELSQDNGFGKAYKIACRDLRDNKDVNISFATEQLLAGVCHVKLYSDAASGNQAVTVYTTQNCVLAPDMAVAGSKRECNLVMRVFTPCGAEEKETAGQEK